MTPRVIVYFLFIALGLAAVIAGILKLRSRIKPKDDWRPEV